jgi:hypothetical protein
MRAAGLGVERPMDIQLTPAAADRIRRRGGAAALDFISAVA